MRILLVEDDIKIAAFIIKGLKAEGFAVDQDSTAALLAHVVEQDLQLFVVVREYRRPQFESRRQARPAGSEIWRDDCDIIAAFRIRRDE